MATAKKISIALPPEMVHIVRGAVATGEYASSSEVIRDALRDWTYKRNLRQQGVTELRRVWLEAVNSVVQIDELVAALNRITDEGSRVNRSLAMIRREQVGGYSPRKVPTELKTG